MYKRIIEDSIISKLFCGKAIIIVGARQVGKTTLIQQLIQDENFDDNVQIFNCDDPTDRELLNNKDFAFFKQLIGKKNVIFIDEGQKVETIGQTVKLLVDGFGEEKQIFVTGSSSLNLLDRVQEPLTGRKFVYLLHPLSLEEIYPDNKVDLYKNLQNYLIFGNYPEVVQQKTFDDKIALLNELESSYLFKDIYEFQQVKNPQILRELLKALALQIGSQVSHAELANILNIDKNTVAKYIDLLEKNFVIYRLPPYTHNKRREISKLKKIYFYDLGIRNALLNNFNFLDSRNDVGALWENFVITERLKYCSYHNIQANRYFWRTYDGAEIDLVEERGGKLHGYEIKWSEKKRPQRPQTWIDDDEHMYNVITPSKLMGFIF